jgi:DNA-binding winged helix-turn-helix (wHTH) protein/WD40 repeat protein
MSLEVEKRHLAGRHFRIGEWLVEPSLNRLSRGDTTIQLELKVMDVLVCLAERAGEVVTRQEIVDRVWATEFISDNTLTHAITEIRNALGDDARNPSFIETIHRRGYRLIAPVEAAVPDEAQESKVARFPVRERPETGTEDRSPYPGLAAFTEADAEFFFGREDEVAKMWRKLTSRRLLAVIGPSGVGKSSFLRAGVIPAKPEGWGVLVCQPGEAPFASLARALVPEFEGDREAISKLVDREPAEMVVMVGRWRERHEQALLIVDQFEELFTLNPAVVQARFAELLRRLVDESDAHVLLSMRDDFLHRCHDHDALEPIFDSLTPVKAPAGRALRRALVTPAKRQGFAFEDDDLPGEMVIEVEGERGALPLLAFAVARLWDKRDQEGCLLTRQAYGDIGGVGGALARHAENTLKAAGDHRLPIVREVFRNLVTAQGTRAVRSVDDLMSVFPDDRRDDATEVLGRLIDARLLTSFEEEGVEGAASHHHVEVVHESLLSSWPRLVGWQTQDADSARLRDELRQAAKAWEEHDRPDDWLWTGAQYREFASWRERYPGGLSAVEEDFGKATTAHAKRRKRRRRIAVAAAFVFLLAVLAVIGSFWLQSDHEARRAEAAELVALGQLELEGYPTASVAHAIASLELADSQAARMLALEALWKGPPAMVVNEKPTGKGIFTSDGRWLVQAVDGLSEPLNLIGADGFVESLTGTEGYGVGLTLWFPVNDLFPAYHHDQETGERRIALWSAKERRKLAEAQYESGRRGGYQRLWTDDRMMTLVSDGSGRYSVDTLSFDGEQRNVGSRVIFNDYDPQSCAVRMNFGGGHWLAATNGHDIYACEIGEHGISEPRWLGRQPELVSQLRVDPLGRFIASGESGGRIRFWPLNDMSPPQIIQGPKNLTDPWVTRDGRFLRANSRPPQGEMEQWLWSLEGDEPVLLRRFSLGSGGRMTIGVFDPIGRQFYYMGAGRKLRLWPMSAPADAEPIDLLVGEVEMYGVPEFHPDGTWLAFPGNTGLTLWPLTWPSSFVIRQHNDAVNDLVFEATGKWLASSSHDGTVRVWPLDGEVPARGRVLGEFLGYMFGLATSPEDQDLLVAGPLPGGGIGGSMVHRLSVDGETQTALLKSSDTYYRDVALSPDGNLAATFANIGREFRIDLWDAHSFERIAVLAERMSVLDMNLQFVGNNQLVAVDDSGLRRWDITTGESELLFEGIKVFLATADGRKLLISKEEGKRSFVDLDARIEKHLETHGDSIRAAALDVSGEIAVTGDLDGTIRVGPVTGEDPHLLLGHDHEVRTLAIDPLGRWIASGSEDNSIRLWPMPDLSKPPLHTLPREELIAKLKTLTNLRVVRDEESSAGWKLEVGPFPGWETVPEW